MIISLMAYVSDIIDTPAKSLFRQMCSVQKETEMQFHMLTGCINSLYHAIVDFVVINTFEKLFWIHFC